MSILEFQPSILAQLVNAEAFENECFTVSQQTLKHLYRKTAILTYQHPNRIMPTPHQKSWIPCIKSPDPTNFFITQCVLYIMQCVLYISQCVIHITQCVINFFRTLHIFLPRKNQLKTSPHTNSHRSAGLQCGLKANIDSKYIKGIIFPIISNSRPTSKNSQNSPSYIGKFSNFIHWEHTVSIYESYN